MTKALLFARIFVFYGKEGFILQKFILFGSIVNFFTVLVGGLAGTLLRKVKLPERLQSGIMAAMALCVMYIGIDGMFNFKYPAAGINIIVCIVSMALGVLLGELLNIDKGMMTLGNALQKRMGKGEQGDNSIAEGFVSCTVIFCVGAMAIVGSIDCGLSADHDTILAKSVIDCITCFFMATNFGIGCAFSALPTFLYQGTITVIAWGAGGALESLMQGSTFGLILNEMSLCGSIVIFAIGLNMMGLTKTRVANFLTCLFMPILCECILLLV